MRISKKVLFLINAPKCELHAHLNGSLRPNAIKKLQMALENAGEIESDKEEGVVYSVDSRTELTFDQIFALFGHVHRLTATPLGLKLATELALKDFAKDQVIYLELRTTPKDTEHMTKREYLLCVLEAIKNAVEVKEGRIKVKILPSFNRAHSVKEAEEILDIVLDLHQGEYNNLIAGIDLSGDPKKGNFKDFIPVLTKAKENGLPLALHCGEMDNPEEIEQMIEFGMQRCGHGTFLTPAQRARLAAKNIATECCISSNVIGRTVNSYDEHHFKDIFNKSYPVVICTDDSGVFNTDLSRELAIAALTFKLPNYDLRKLCENSLKYAFLSDEEKLPLQQKMDNYFKSLKQLQI